MKKATLLQRTLAAAAIGVLAGCATPTPPLYLWDAFPAQQYKSLAGNGASPDEQLQVLQAQEDKARGTNAALPPGFRAHMGKLYLAKGDTDRARSLWAAEKAAFPESAPYIDQLLSRLKGQTGVAKEGNPQ